METDVSQKQELSSAEMRKTHQVLQDKYKLLLNEKLFYKIAYWRYNAMFFLPCLASNFLYRTKVISLFFTAVPVACIGVWFLLKILQTIRSDFECEKRETSFLKEALESDNNQGHLSKALSVLENEIKIRSYPNDVITKLLPIAIIGATTAFAGWKVGTQYTDRLGVQFAVITISFSALTLFASGLFYIWTKLERKFGREAR